MLTSAFVDQREPAHIKALTFGGLPTSVCLLDAGDVMCTTDDDNVLVIERKTANDLLNTLRDDRLFAQMCAIRDASSWAYLIISGTLMPAQGGTVLADSRATGWSWASVSGALLTVQEMGVHVLQVPNDQAFEQAVITLGNRNRNGVSIAPARSSTIVTPALAVLAALPGIGEERAAAVLKHCGCAAWAFSYLTRLGENGVPGIGDGIKARVRQVLGVAAGCELSVIETN